MIYIKESKGCDSVEYDCKKTLDELRIVEHNKFTEGTTTYEYFKYGNGMLIMFGESTISRDTTKTITTVSFPKVSFSDTEYTVQLTPNRNATLLSKLVECGTNGNRVRTESSFQVASEGQVSEYHCQFAFNVIGHWK